MAVIKNIEHLEREFLLRTAEDEDIPGLRKLINEAYKELSDQGWNYTATYQDEETTRQRIQKCKAFILEENKQIVATILYFKENHFTGKNTAYVGQFAVAPSAKKSGLGTLLMDYCEALALAEKYDGIQLDTAKPAEHLVKWYLRRGFKIVGETHWEGKTYDSYIFEKLFIPR
ncbi:MAG: GNAT family N-acetyltransferase [Pseudobdellovibrionaceae bacterium]